MRSLQPRHAVLAAGLLALHAGLLTWSARTQSATFDEPALLAAGTSYWRTGDLRMESQDPPLGLLWLGVPGALAGAKLPLDGPEWAGGYVHAFADRLLFFSGNDPAALLRGARAMNVALSALLAALLWACARRRWGEGPALATLALYALSPTVLAHASLATLDAPAMAAVTCAVLALASWLERPGPAAAAAFAAAMGAALLCKYSTLVALPAAAAAVALDARARAAARKAAPALIGALCLGAAAVLLWPQTREGLARRLFQAASGSHPSFLLGRLSDHGWLCYYAVAAAVKSTLPELIAGAATAAWLLRASRRGDEGRGWALAGLATAACYLAAASLSRKQLGIRYVLPVYPALAVAAAPAARALLRRRRGALLAGCLVAWQAACALAAGPDWLSYFNEAAGGPERGERWLADSNLDWGQDLGRLAAWAHAQGDPPLVLAYFGTDSPDRFGLRPQLLRANNQIQRRRANAVDAPRELLAISVTHLQQVYWRPPALPPELLRAEPLARVGRTLRVYDIGRDPGVHRWLADVYAADGDSELAGRELARASWLARQARR